MSSLQCIYIGHPGVVLFSLLFSLYANDCFSKDLSVKIVMFDDDHRPYQGHRCGVEQLALWCSQISLEVNTLKTVAVTVELRSPSPLCLLATIFQDLKWSLSGHYYQKGRAEPAPAQELQPASGGDDLFNSAIIQVVFCSLISVLFGSASMQDKNRLRWTVKSAGKTNPESGHKQAISLHTLW